MNSRAGSAMSFDCGESISGFFRWTTPIIPLTPGNANGGSRIRFSGVMHGQRPVARWRPPRPAPLWRGQRTELEAQRCRLPLQRPQLIPLGLGLVLLHRPGYVLLAVLEHPVDQTGHLVGGRLHGPEPADPAADA